MDRDRLKFLRLLAACVLLVFAQAGLAAEREIPPAFGPHTNPVAADFKDAVSYKRGDRLVGTYYFYWYDAPSKPLVNRDGTDSLTTHPPRLDDFSYKSVRWHRTQLEDMMAAGIDFLLPVFWGAPSDHHARKGGRYWSYEGLPPLVRAREELLREGKSPPRIGLFYDTSTLRINAWGYHADLTTDYGRRWFYGTIRDFFSLVPARHWAMIEGRPLVFLYVADFAPRHDQSVIDYTRREFAREFGGRQPWIALEKTWKATGDAVVAWGGALGLQNPGIASLGPGYDHSAVLGRKPLVVDRRGGAFYEENWMKLLRNPSNIVMIETWNEFHEGSDIAESKEYGRQYIELTRKYVDLFKSGRVPR